MQLSPEQLGRQLERGLATAYLISGDEPLLADECAAAIRQRAVAEGYSERQLFSVETGFDWDSLLASTQALSLFSERRLIELRLPTGRPGEAGGQILKAVAEDPPPDTVLLVITGKLDKAQRESAWVQAVGTRGAHIALRPLEPGRLPAWLSQRFSARNLKPEAGVVELLAWHLEGNLLAAAQEVEKLAMLAGSGPVRLADAEASLSDSARFSVYQLVDKALAGDADDVCRMLTSLHAEGAEPILILWALARELRSLASLSLELGRGKPEATLLARVWQNRRALVGKALRRFPSAVWLGFMRRAARLDRVIKGRAGGDVWLELERLLLAVAGIKPFVNARAELEMNT